MREEFEGSNSITSFSVCEPLQLLISSSINEDINQCFPLFKTPRVEFTYIYGETIKLIFVEFTYIHGETIKLGTCQSHTLSKVG